MQALGTTVGSALGPHVSNPLGAWLFSRFNTWSTSDHPPHSCWPPTDCIQKEAQQQTAWSQRTFANQILNKQSSAQILRVCSQLELPSQAGLCHQNTNNQAFSTVLISTNWSIASNAQLSSRPLDFVMMHLMHKGGITTIASCCRDMFMYRTYLNRNIDTETIGEAQDQLQGCNFNQSSAHI